VRSGSTTKSALVLFAAFFSLAALVLTVQRSANPTAVWGGDSQTISLPPQTDIQLTAPKYPVAIRKPDGPPRVFTGIKDANGNDVTVSCSTCHSVREPDFGNNTDADLDEFHGTIVVDHGQISCLSCHNPFDYDSLKLADGRRVEYSEVMTLCGQCHGPQLREYMNGAHGGMSGYWDLSRGPRNKNNCVDCHYPHLPQFPKMQPTFKPADRFLREDRHE
jgi:hypothetical protein